MLQNVIINRIHTFGEAFTRGGGGGAHYGMNFLLFCLQEDSLITGTFVHDLFIIFNEHFCYFYFLKCYAA